MERTVTALRAAVDAADAGAFGELLAPEVQWLGAQGGACHGRDDVLAVLGAQLAVVRPRLAGARTVGDGVLLEVDLLPVDGSDAARWLAVLTIGPAGLVTRIQDYLSAEVAERDQALRAGGDAAALPQAAVTRLVPFVHVADVARSVAFYRLLGMTVERTYEPDGEIVWASLRHDGASLMLARADAPVDPRDQAVLFYLYAPDLSALRTRLVAAGAQPGEIVDGTPGPREEMRLSDPDGYCLMIAQLDDRPR